ncbi:MAG: tripartite tricarboxylate transporter permease [Candidatus Pacearchaeota archaeon]
MWVYLVIAFLLGILIGTFTGIIPGIHINLVSLILISIITPAPEKIPSILVFIVSMAITHTFIDFIPAIFLGAPDEDTGLGVMPGHELLLKGLGHHAVRLTIIGSTIAITSLIIIIPLFFLFLPRIYPFLNKMMGWILIWASIFLIYTEKNSKTKALIIFFLSGILGIGSLNIGLKEPLLPLLTGLFGSSTIIYSIRTKTKIPKQKVEKIPVLKKDIIKPSIITILVSPICAILPGLGASQGAIIGSAIGGKTSREQFLILLGSVNTLVTALSFYILFLINKSRTGVASAISQITKITTEEMILIFVAILISTIILIPYTNFLSKKFAKHINKINYSKISIFVLILLILIVAVISGPLGLLVFTISTLIGLTCIEFNVRKGFLMGTLLIPTIIYYLPI